MTCNAKKTVSTSAVFRSHASRKQQENSLKEPSKVSKSRSHKKHKAKAEHSLANQFNDSIERSRETIFESAMATINATNNTLTTRLTKTRNQAASFIQNATAENIRLGKPLKKEQLVFQGASRKPDGVGIASLGIRMKEFNKVVDTEEKALTILWKEWAEVQSLITESCIELLGQDVKVILATEGPSGLEAYADAQSAELEQEMERQKARFIREVEKLEGNFIKKWRDGEKRLSIRVNKDAQKIRSAMENERP